MQRLVEKLMLASPDQQISLTDPDRRSMVTSGRGSGVFGYNVQVAVADEAEQEECKKAIEAAAKLCAKFGHRVEEGMPQVPQSALSATAPAPVAQMV
jgi:hypothetical protein